MDFYNKWVIINKIYDGPYPTSPVLLHHNDSVSKLSSIRSTGSDLFVEFFSYQLDRKKEIEFFYISVNRVITFWKKKHTNGNFTNFRWKKLQEIHQWLTVEMVMKKRSQTAVHKNIGLLCSMYIKCPMFLLTGCGGYVNGNGVIAISASDDDHRDCFWFIESRQGYQQTILLARHDASLTASDAFYPMTVNNRRIIVSYLGYCKKLLFALFRCMKAGILRGKSFTTIKLKIGCWKKQFTRLAIAKWWCILTTQPMLSTKSRYFTGTWPV